MTESKNITLPYCNVGENLGWELMRLPDDEYRAAQRKLVAKCYADNGVDYDHRPVAWSESPLAEWCWLILEVNDLERDPEVHHPLIHWGIDLGFASTGLRSWIWAIS